MRGGAPPIAVLTVFTYWEWTEKALKTMIRAYGKRIGA
tara:strand:+ start:286 stop:399 length:114 start_codon:yes stop_codon:yes gene_type:complete